MNGRSRPWLQQLAIWCVLYLTLSSQLAVAQASTSSVLISDQSSSLPIFVAEESDPLILWAAEQLQQDITDITGNQPRLLTTRSFQGNGIYIGQVNARVFADGKLISASQRQALNSQWEGFSLHRANRSLILSGSDVRGTVYAIFTLTERLGVSPWKWWADVHPLPQSSLSLDLAEDGVQSAPGVKYRGIFLNDEDWGLRPWAANTLAPQEGNIGPTTYEKVFQLLLRLRANSIWPAMHPGSEAFFRQPHTLALARRYHMVIGSSHAEPMLRNNVAEWDNARLGDYNYFTNRKAVDAYWQSRVNDLKQSQLEAMLTLGMRGVHDSHMEGAATPADAAAVLSEVIRTQRSILSSTLRQPLTSVPQVLIPYKEVLELYQLGLDVPDDVTLVWPDDNYGYIRHLSDANEQTRSGSSGVYYHLSYWGRPHDYLWLSTTQPGLIWYEMSRAWQHGADRVWIANVGDIKPAEYNLELFLDMAWTPQVSSDWIGEHLQAWAGREFGAALAAPVSAMMSQYYQLAMLRKPEFMGWSQTEPTTQTTQTAFSWNEAQRRLKFYHELEGQMAELKAKVPKERQSAWFELVEYPIAAATAMNEKFLYRQMAAQSQVRAVSDNCWQRALAAYQRIQTLTQQYQQLEQGKWMQMMSASPRHLPVFAAPTPLSELPASDPKREDAVQYWQAADYTAASRPDSGRWLTVTGLGYSNRAVTRMPITGKYKTQPWLEYQARIDTPGEYQLQVRTLPTHSNDGDQQVCVTVHDESQCTGLNTQGRSETWKQNVLRNATLSEFHLSFPAPGVYPVRVSINQSGIVLDQLALSPQSATPGYEIPFIN